MKCLKIVFLIVIILIIVPMFIVGFFENENKQQIVEEQQSDIILNQEKEPIYLNVYNHYEDKIVRMRLSEYLYGVVAAEMPVSFEEEALKAQAVASRTLAVNKMHSFGGRGCEKAADADVCTDYRHCQAWISYDQMKSNWGKKYKENLKKIKKAVDETAQQIVVYNQKPIEIFFYSTSNGKTEDAGEVFSYSLPYYRVVESRGEESSTRYSETKDYSQSEFKSILKTYYPEIKTTGDLDQNIRNIKYTDSGRVSSLEIYGVEIKGTKFRVMFGLNSADFRFSYGKDNILIKTKGYGHGVGMSQNGANVMAKEGKSFIDIINHYYVGTTIKKI